MLRTAWRPKTATVANPWARKLEQFAPLLDALISQPTSAAARAVIIAEGAAPGDLHVILKGGACRYKVLPNGRRPIMGFLLPGDPCDLHVFVLQRMDHSIGALVPTVFATIPRERILEVLARRPRLTRALWWSALQDEAILREWLVGMGRRGAYQRVAHLLCEVFRRLRAVGETAPDHSCTLPLTQTDLADALGLTNVHVNRTLQRLRNDRLIAQHGKRLTIIDPERLESAAEFDPSYLHIQSRAPWAFGFTPSVPHGRT